MPKFTGSQRVGDISSAPPSSPPPTVQPPPTISPPPPANPGLASGNVSGPSAAPAPAAPLPPSVITPAAQTPDAGMIVTAPPVPPQPVAAGVTTSVGALPFNPTPPSLFDQADYLAVQDPAIRRWLETLTGLPGIKV